MKRHVLELPIWCLVVVISLLITVIWFVFALTSHEISYVIGISGNGRPLYQDSIAYQYDGSLVQYTPNWATRVQLLEPPTVGGLIMFWWPAAAGTGVALLSFLASLLPARGQLLRKRIRIPRPRVTMFRMMVVIGTVSAWLWLGRFELYTRAAGTLVFGLMLYAGFRRSFLTRESSAERAPATVLSRAGIAGYSVALLLALAWVISILIWDSYQARSL